MSRTDGTDCTVARNQDLETPADVAKVQEHNEREKDSYSNQDIGEGKLRMLIDQNPHEDFYVMNGNRALIKREKFERYLDQATAV
jgi:hypothetical protein